MPVGSVAAVPRIDAPTVGEHHERQLALLLDAALDVVARHDVERLTLAELAKRTGRSRASLYAYFGSTDDLRVALCGHALAGWVADVLADVHLATTPAERIERFVAAQIEHPRDVSVDRLHAFATAQTSDAVRAQVRAVTEPLAAVLLATIEELGVEPPTRAATMVQGAIAAASDQVRAGAMPREVAEDTVAFVRAGLDALRSPGGTDRHDRTGVPARRRSAGTRGTASSPSALARCVAPSPAAWLASTLAIGIEPSREPSPAPRARGSRARAGRAAVLAVAQLAWAVVGFATGITGIGGTAWHAVLGVSLVAILAWSARVAGPLHLGAAEMRSLAALAASASVVALVAGHVGFDGAVAVHIALAAVLVAGLGRGTRRAWRGWRTAPAGSQPA